VTRGWSGRSRRDGEERVELEQEQEQYYRLATMGETGACSY
jgi:hypothetical protein